MNWIEEVKSIKSGPKELRSFGLTVGGVFALIGLLLCWKGRGAGPALFLTGAGLLIAGFAIPSVLKPVQKAWMTLALAMGWVMTRVILSIVFYLVLTPLGLLVKLSAKDLLDLKLEPDAKSYWHPRKRKYQKSDYEKQY